MLISFVIPSFNSSGTIKRCLDSIYGLSIDNSIFEVIVVDDCSTDSTVALLKEYACSHRNLVLLRQPENHRQGAARNKGTSVAKGKYIIFVDSDDETAKGVVAAVQKAEDEGLDMIAMRCSKSVHGIEKEQMSLPFKKGDLFSGYEMQTNFPFWGTAPWSYIIRSHFWIR